MQTATNMIYYCLFDKDLPVWVMAATSLHKLFDIKGVIEFLKPALKNLLEVYLKLMNEIENEELVSGLE